MAIDPLLSERLLEFCLDKYVAPNGDRRHPLVPPVHADLTGLPPLLIMVGTTEVLLDDSMRFAAKAAGAGVGVELIVGAGMIPSCPFFAAFFPDAREGIDVITEFMRRRLGLKHG
jgi:monoterpene epsilon-lactone hydrolase